MAQENMNNLGVYQWPHHLLSEAYALQTAKHTWSGHYNNPVRCSQRFLISKQSSSIGLAKILKRRMHNTKWK